MDSPRSVITAVTSNDETSWAKTVSATKVPPTPSETTRARAIRLRVIGAVRSNACRRVFTSSCGGVLQMSGVARFGSGLERLIHGNKTAFCARPHRPAHDKRHEQSAEILSVRERG